MSKSSGKFFYACATWCSRDTSRLRSVYLLASVPYRNQLNFTFDGLKQRPVRSRRLRNFRCA